MGDRDTDYQRVAKCRIGTAAIGLELPSVD